MRKVIKYLTITLLVVILLPVVFMVALYHSADMGEPNLTYNFQNLKVSQSGDSILCHNSYLRQDSCGIWELMVEGSGQERGAIQGILTADLMRYQEDVFINQIREIIPSDRYLGVLRSFIVIFNRNLGRFIPLEYREEIAAMAEYCTRDYDAIGTPYQRQLNYHGAHDIGHAMQQYMLVGCSSFATWGGASENKSLIVGRNFDFFVGDDFAKNKIITFAVPESGYRYASIGWAGMVGVLSGINECGLTVTINAAKGAIPLSAATPISIVTREILQYASNIDEALEIAKSRQLFVSESILIGSLKDNRAAIIEKTPKQTALYSVGGETILCTNHFQSELLANTDYNRSNIADSDSKYRYDRLKQLIERDSNLNYVGAIDVLRNRYGIDDADVGIGNEMTLNQSICHHSVVFEPSRALMWVSTEPWQSGGFICYDLKGFFNGTSKPVRNKNLDVDADTSFIINDLPKLLSYRESISIVKSAISNSTVLDDSFIESFNSTNPNHYYTHRIMGDYFLKMNQRLKAINSYKRAVSCQIPYNSERKEIDAIINKLQQ